ncbi:MAG TPA: CRISPR-associated protein Cas4 [Chloroflexota bacterium]
MDQDLIPVSALEHYSYCPRQCAFIHVEQVFEDNVFTERGHIAHRNVDSGPRADAGIHFSLPIWSDRLGLIGRADAVEMRGGTIFPIEHKVSRRRHWVHEEYQLCAQALCLEEMFGVNVPEGAIFYRGSQERRRVSLGSDLRKRTEALVEEIRAMLRRPTLPVPVDDRRCRHCSLAMVCLPHAVANPRAVERLRAQLFRA